ncbi:hypothetical protein TELCIR_11145 [Teladorsagia circumcincta]|uniref:Translation initiation factor beta propellor-like domain-containing protein n=1 Tax=Teladorsagia circumcincta TaxID=45464 RepID=A0A2G9UA63_TELCI|nr:hypothetical protein TELCIR_11145 [Teladorsagia circumcincta]
MQHPRCRDQFAVQYEKDGVPTVACYWHIKGHDPEIAGEPGKAERPSWTDTVFKWSPHGSYMTTIHKRGVALWGGPEFARVQRFAHDNVQFIDFSPCETYLVTYAEAGEKNHWGDDEDCLRIWDVVTGEMLKGYSLYALTNRDQLPCWPFFQWSFDEKYFACLKAPEKDKLEKEKKMPNQQRLRSGRIHNVADAQMFWQKSGQRLAVYTMRYSKKQMKEGGEVKYVGGCTYHLEIFEIDKKDVSLMNLPLPEPFINFGWQPYGEKFCVLTGNQAKVTPLVYRLEPNSHAPKLMSKLDPGVQFNEVSWAPHGGWLAILAKRSNGGNVMFVDTTLQEAKRTNVVEHPGFNKGYWDPTGRYFVTCSTLGGRIGADLGFRLYTFQGRELCRKALERLTQFKWRPRPPVKLSDQKLKEIKNNLKKTAVRFEREDNEEKNRASQEVIERRRKIMAAFELIRQKNLKKIAAQRELRISLRGGVDTDNKQAEELVEEQIMVALDTQKTLAPLGDDELD